MKRIGLAWIVVLVAGVLPAFGWEWPTEFTSGSSSRLVELHERLHAVHGGGLRRLDVRDRHWSHDDFDLQMTAGALYVEPALDGSTIGAYFRGRGFVSFRPQASVARGNLALLFGESGLERVPVSEAYLFALDGVSLAESEGRDSAESMTGDALAGYAACKKAFRQLGLDPLLDFLNRRGRAAGTFRVLFPVEAIRRTGSRDAYVLYSFLPGERNPARLSVFGHAELADREETQHLFRTVVRLDSEGHAAVPPGRVKLYRNRVTVGQDRKHVEEESLLRFAPTGGLSGLRLSLTPRLEVQRVLDPGGAELPFAQWRFLPGEPNPDRHLLIALPRPLEEGQEVELLVASGGPLFELGATSDLATGDVATAYRLTDEDDWHPRLDDPDAAHYELTLSLPRRLRGVAAGRQIEERVEGGRRLYEFRTGRPHKRTSFYFGDFKVSRAQADGTTVEVFVDRDSGGDARYVAAEARNMVRVFNRILGPLDLDHLRVVGTPTNHGRGFEGVILLSQLGGFHGSDSGADLFRAHEVAHQWWGNKVQPRFWPEDRWLSEAFAEYMAMEYYLVRYQKPRRMRDLVHRQWAQPLTDATTVVHETLTGERSRVRSSQLVPVFNGGPNVYTKGPLILHMLRYLCQVHGGGDEHFWDLLRDFLERYGGREASSADFMRLAEEHLELDLGWFWEQWLYGTTIPVVRWSRSIEPDGEGWRVAVEARQESTAFVLLIPVHVHLDDGRTLTRPLLLQGATGSTSFPLAERPRRITLNDYSQSLVVLKH